MESIFALTVLLSLVSTPSAPTELDIDIDDSEVVAGVRQWHLLLLETARRTVDLQCSDDSCSDDSSKNKTSTPNCSLLNTKITWIEENNRRLNSIYESKSVHRYTVTHTELSTFRSIDSQRFPVNIIRTRCFAVADNGDRFDFQQPGGWLSPLVVDGACSTPFPCEAGHSYVSVLEIFNSELWLTDESETVDITALENGTCATADTEEENAQ